MSGVLKIEDRAYEFALRTIKLVRALPKESAGRVLGQQVLRAGTSIGANSKRDFVNKMAIAQKEARETHYWLRLIRDSQMVPAERIAPLVQESLELKKILSKTVSTARKNLASKTN